MSYPHTGYDLRNCAGASGFIFSGNEKMIEKEKATDFVTITDGANLSGKAAPPIEGILDLNQIISINQMAKKIAELEKRIDKLQDDIERRIELLEEHD